MLCAKVASVRTVRARARPRHHGKGTLRGLPLAAVAGPARLLQRWPPSMHTSTFQGNPLACAMAVANIDTILEGNLIERVTHAIEPILKRLDNFAGTRVIGAQAAVPLTRPGEEPGARHAVALQRACLEAGLLVYAGGRHGESLMLVPPLIVGESELGAAVERVAALLASEEFS